ncbi:MAG: hypothetical protein KDK70_02010 [Myxococcales bacterium]|nr:hypothetical protein [Myxococcales bacterium]
MIRVEPRPEPPDFDQKVRKPGRRALAELRGEPAPSRRGPKRGVKELIESKDLRPYWTRCLDDLHREYRGICAYSCLYIPHVVGSKTTDHFSAKTTRVSPRPEDAYEWSNYRLACGLMNSRKGTKTVIDPFEIVHDEGWFQLDLSTLGISPNPGLPEALRERIQGTIEALGLDDDECRGARADWYRPYLEGEITFSFLEKKCPFLAAEIVRQLGRPPESRTRRP